jgi:hypothetical protein
MLPGQIYSQRCLPAAHQKNIRDIDFKRFERDNANNGKQLREP